VKARTWEVGVRLALGASPRRVVLAMMGEAGRRVLAGAIVGVAAFLAIGRLIAGLLYNTSIGEPMVLTSAVLPLCSVAFLVCYWQARRLARVSPVLALRNDSSG
jgi:ABC-type antimicrobial peptide transport system permease subunit